MAERLREWATGKAGEIADRVYGILSKYTGVRFKVCPIFMDYKNKWGVFFGRVALGSNGRFYRLNFIKGGGTMEIVSMDAWARGADIRRAPPKVTCSLNGFGITKCITYLKDFIAAPEMCITEGAGVRGWGAARLDESKKETLAWTAEFLAGDARWQQAWAAGSVDEKQYAKDFKAWVKAQGRDFTGARGPTTEEIVNCTKDGLAGGARSVAAQSGVPPQSAARMAAGAAKVPSSTTAPAAAAGQETRIDLSDVYDEKVTYDQIVAAMENDKRGPLVQIRMYKQYLENMIRRGQGDPMLIVWGKGGIGKTKTLMDTLDENGEVHGVSWEKITGQSKLCRSPGAFMSWVAKHCCPDLCPVAPLRFVVIDDNDAILKRADFTNVWKNVTAGDKLVVADDDDKDRDKDILPGEYDIGAKFIVLTNLSPAQLFPGDTEGAMSSRYTDVAFDFTNAEIVAYISTHLKDIYPGIDMDDKVRIFNLMWKRSQRLAALGQTSKSKGIDFRSFNSVLRNWEMSKLCGDSFAAWFTMYFSKKMNVSAKPAEDEFYGLA